MSLHEPIDLSDLDTFDIEEFEAAERERAAERKKEKRRRYTTPNYRKRMGYVPVRKGPYVIVPEIAPILQQLAEVAAREASYEIDENSDTAAGVGILAARAALILGVSQEAATRRLYAVIHKKQLFINARFVEACLMAMDAEHEFNYGEWPSNRNEALERVSIEAELNGKRVSPSKLLAKANRLYEKGYRKAMKRAGEVPHSPAEVTA